jgi:hypothetical protein
MPTGGSTNASKYRNVLPLIGVAITARVMIRHAEHDGYFS